jgi:hypothetical protein
MDQEHVADPPELSALLSPPGRLPSQPMGTILHTRRTNLHTDGLHPICPHISQRADRKPMESKR